VPDSSETLAGAGIMVVDDVLKKLHTAPVFGSAVDLFAVFKALATVQPSTSNTIPLGSCVDGGTQGPGATMTLDCVQGATGTPLLLFKVPTGQQVSVDSTAYVQQAQPAATLGVTVTPAGSGSVVSFPSGISCGSACTASYPVGTPVGLSATSTSAAFLGWSGACS